MAPHLRHPLLNHLYPLPQLHHLLRVSGWRARSLPRARQLRHTQGPARMARMEENGGPGADLGLQETPLVLGEVRGGILQPQVLQQPAQEELQGAGVDTAATGRAEGDIRQLRQRDRHAHVTSFARAGPAG